MKADDFDYALPFLFFTTLGVLGMMALLSCVFAYLGWPGPLGLVKGGVA